MAPERSILIVEDDAAVDIVDVGLPDGDGRDFCANLRWNGHKMPVIILTGRDGEQDIVRGFDSGANGYIAKPFRLNELLARLCAQCRAFDSSEAAAFSLGPFVFHPSKKLLHDPINNRRIRLTSKEVAILKYLYRSEDRRVVREILLHELWGYNAAVTTHALQTHICRLRQKIEPAPRCLSLLVFDRGGGLSWPRAGHDAAALRQTHRGILSGSIRCSQQSEPPAANFGHDWNRAFPHAIGRPDGKDNCKGGQSHGSQTSHPDR